jgi:hypothetical protein
MSCNVLVLAVIAAMCMLAARRLRGRTSWTDAFFPFLWLHLGHWENMLWGSQLFVILGALLVSALLLCIVRPEGNLTAGHKALAALCLLAMPLCGVQSVVLVPALALWIAYMGMAEWRSAAPQSRRNGLLLLAAAVASCILAALTVLNFQAPPQHPYNPGLAATLRGAVEFLGTGVGRMASAVRPLTATGAGLLILATAVLLARSWKTRVGDRTRLSGLLLFLGGMVMLALAIGWGRAGRLGTDPTAKFRYAAMAAPALACAYFAWSIYGPPLLSGIVRACLFAALLMAVPYNGYIGHRLGSVWKAHGDALLADVHSGLSTEEVAARHWQNYCSSQQEFTECLESLKRAGIGPYRH